MWKVYALLSAFFAALTAVFAKLGVRDVDANLATAIRTTVILFITWGVVFILGGQGAVRELSRPDDLDVGAVRGDDGFVLVVLLQGVAGGRGVPGGAGG